MLQIMYGKTRFEYLFFVFVGEYRTYRSVHGVLLKIAQCKVDHERRDLYEGR